MKLSACHRCDNCGSSILNIGYVLKCNCLNVDKVTAKFAFQEAKSRNKGLAIEIDAFYNGRAIVYELPYRNQEYIEVDIVICANCITLARTDLLHIIDTIHFNRGY